MATKKKSENKSKKAKKSASRKVTSTKKKTVETKLARKKETFKKLAKKKTAKKLAVKTPSVGKKAMRRKTVLKRGVRRAGQSVDTVAFPLEGQESRPGRQSGDLQGLSSVEGADSESVGELIEEGNAFEANVVAGVEDAGNANEKEVRTHEVPEDDVPGEYLDLDEK
jgi:hypothetical protein